MTELIGFIKSNFVWIAGIITASKWVYEYSQKLRWEKSKFLLERIEGLLERESTQYVHSMLDWNLLELDFDGVKVKIDDHMLYESLQTHDMKHSFTRHEMKIREFFDEYFDGMTELLILSACGLINKKDLAKFMEYWISILNGKRSSKTERLNSQINEYMLFYGFKKLHRFIHHKPRLF